MKKIFAILLIALLMLTMVSCSKTIETEITKVEFYAEHGVFSFEGLFVHEDQKYAWQVFFRPPDREHLQAIFDGRFKLDFLFETVDGQLMLTPEIILTKKRAVEVKVTPGKVV